MIITIRQAYRTLGLTREASPEEVKKAYRKLALQFHPDKNPDPAATSKFQQISAAYKLIDDYLNRSHKQFHPDLCPADFDDFDEDYLGSDDLFNIPTMEEMLVMFDVLFGSSSQKIRRQHKSKKGNGGVRVQVRRKGGKSELPGLLSDKELMNLFAYGMMLDDLDTPFSDSKEEMRSMTSIFTQPQPRDSLEKRTECCIDITSETKTDAVVNPTPKIGSKVLLYGKHMGVVKFTGRVHYAKGEFVGVALSSPVGKNNGSIKGVKYFDCPPSHGLMVRPNDIIFAA
ncbi:putative CAP Gly-rich domain, DnaJ domain, CAP Gly-rich domain superfamily protein [Plasmopara halstedii]